MWVRISRGVADKSYHQINRDSDFKGGDAVTNPQWCAESCSGNQKMRASSRYRQATTQNVKTSKRKRDLRVNISKHPSQRFLNIYKEVNSQSETCQKSDAPKCKIRRHLNNSKYQSSEKCQHVKTAKLETLRHVKVSKTIKCQNSNIENIKNAQR